MKQILFSKTLAGYFLRVGVRTLATPMIASLYKKPITSCN
jgi:hypothetical protein